MFRFIERKGERSLVLCLLHLAIFQGYMCSKKKTVVYISLVPLGTKEICILVRPQFSRVEIDGATQDCDIPAWLESFAENAVSPVLVFARLGSHRDNHI